MQRYFLELSYKGTAYSGFQAQLNANTIQAEVEKAFFILQKEKVVMTGSSRTDAGVHALQNFFHFDAEKKIHPEFIYKINAILPADIAIKSVRQVGPDAHCRFDARSRKYSYYLYREKDPFLQDRSYYYPYRMDLEKLKDAAEFIRSRRDFTTFSKRNVQVKNFTCIIMQSGWKEEGRQLVYSVRANRFLRGMVRGLVATMLQVGRGNLSLQKLEDIFRSGDNTRARFNVPAHGLFLVGVSFRGKRVDPDPDTFITE
jgi:tRNA pseudouridine38-40 synthase